MMTHELRAQLGDAYARFSDAEQARHVALVESIRRPTDVALDVAALDDGQWAVTVCAADGLGTLSIVAGLFTAAHLDIITADIFTVVLPGRRAEEGAGSRRRAWPPRRGLAAVAPAPSRVLLDIFVVRPLGALAPDTWARFQADLADLVRLLAAGQRAQARDAIIDRVSEVLQTVENPQATLLPVAIELTDEPDAAISRLRVRSDDTIGFLFTFTNALAGFTINIERAVIRTRDGEADDTFWVTDVGGEPIVGEERAHELRVATTLIKQFTHLLPRSPDPGQALRQFNALIAQILARPRWTAELADLETPGVLEAVADLMGVSRFLWEDFLRMQHENLFPVLLDLPALEAPRARAELQADLARRLAERATHAERVAELNAFKDREMFRIDLRHITGRNAFTQFSEELSLLAEVTVAMAAALTEEALHPRIGAPTLADGRPCPWSICALGKFGGRELGFGSDLELLFVYEDEGVTDGPTPLRNSEYFARFVQGFQTILKARQEGIFEIDLRLRPHGKGGHLATTIDGMAQYYAEGGAAEQFERMALVRLRPVAGDSALGERMVAVRDHFVYSGRPLDVENVRHLRHRQATELVAPRLVSAKYSAGGLVDIEYFVQTWQIAVGPADPRARVTNTLAAIEHLTAAGYLPPGRGERLRESYGFLRRLIDALRVVRGSARDLTLPPDTSREFAYLAQRLRHASGDALRAAIAAHMGFARELWRDEMLPGR